MQIRLAHIGINTPDEASAAALAQTLATALLCGFQDGNSSLFVGEKAIEVMKKPGRGTCGHIAFAVDSIEEAMEEMERAGCAFDLSSAKYDGAGRLKAIYLQDEFGGFAIHLLR